MRTKIKFIESVIQELSGGSVSPDTITKFDERVIASRISDIYDKGLTTVWLQQKATRDFSTFDMFSKTYNATVQEDTTRKEYYVDIPVTLVPVPVAIREVRALGVQDGGMIQIDSGSPTLFNSTLVGDVVKDRCYYQDGSRIYFYNYDNFGDVMLRLLPTFADLEDNDSIPVVVIMGNLTLFDYVVNSMRGVQVVPIDKNNDGK
jgi:hypothetical protein